MSAVQRTVPTPPAALLVLAEQEFDWVQALKSAFQQLLRIEKLNSLFTTLQQDSFDLVIIHDKMLQHDTPTIVGELKSRFPGVLLVIMQATENTTYHDFLLSKGADDVIWIGTAVEIILTRFDLLLRQHKRAQQLLQYSQRLHALSMLTQQLYNADNPTSLIADTIHVLCSQFGISGVAITIDEGDTLRLYAGALNQRRLYEAIVQLDEYDPLHHVATSGISMILRKIRNHPHFAPIPGIENPLSAMVLPLRYAQQSLGSLALFSSQEVFTSDDLAPFELLASHFASAYYSVQHYYDREVDIRAKSQLVRAWQALATVQDIPAVVTTLHGLLTGIDTVGKAAVFVFETKNSEQRIVSFSDETRIIHLMNMLNEKDQLVEALNEIDASMHPVTFHQRRAANTPLYDLFVLMECSQIVLVPIAYSTLHGGMFVAAEGNQSFTPQDFNLLESLANAAAQTLERNILINEIQEQKGRLEAVVRSIKEALFFVSETGNVIFCNPQFTELTDILPSQIINNPYQVLFQALAANTEHPSEAFEQLEAELESVLAAEDDNEDYPVLELRMLSINTPLYIEFMHSNLDQQQGGWIGLVRNVQPEDVHPENQPAVDTALFTNLLQSLAIPLFDLQKTALMLPEQYEVLRPRGYIQLLNQLNEKVQSIQTLWKNINDIHAIETSGLPAALSLLDPVEIIGEALENRRFARYNRHIEFSTEPPQVRVQIDERYLLTAISNVIDFMVHYAYNDAPLSLQIIPDEQGLIISAQDKLTVLSTDVLQSAFDLSEENTSSEDFPATLGMYLAREIMHAYNGRITVESHQGWGLVTKLILPIADGEKLVKETSASATRKSSAPTLTMIIVESAARLLHGMDNVLKFEGHKLIVEQDFERAMSNLNLTQIDLIILEADPTNNTVIEATRYIRTRTAIPILIVAPQEAERSCIQALSAGADGYLLPPITVDKLTAQIQSVAKRKDIATRTSPPIQIGNLHIDFSRRRVYVDNKLTDLTTKEYELLKVLVTNRGQVLTHEQLLTQIWGPEYRDETQYLWVNVSRLRRRLEKSKDSPRYIYTEKGVGYVFRDD